MFFSIYQMLESAIFGLDSIIPDHLIPYAEQFIVNLSALFTTAVVLLPFAIVIGVITHIFRSMWR